MLVGVGAVFVLVEIQAGMGSCLVKLDQLIDFKKRETWTEMSSCLVVFWLGRPNDFNSIW